MTNFEQILQDSIDELTPEERRVLKQATPNEITKAINELVRDPVFWGEMCEAFLTGLIEGFRK